MKITKVREVNEVGKMIEFKSKPMQLSTKDFKLEIKSLNDDGTFEGYASVFGVKDNQNDVVETGAFKRTIDHHKGMIPILDQHDPHVEIGMTTEMKEDGNGLYFKGELYIDNDDPKNDVPAARAVYVKMKKRQALGNPLGISIGYSVLQKAFKDTVRHLKELALWEISTVTFAANQLATVTGVKGEELTLEGKSIDFSTSLQDRLARDYMYQLQDALWTTIYDIKWSSETTDNKITLFTQCANTFRDALVNWANNIYPTVYKSDGVPEEGKSERALSPAMVAAVKDSINALTALRTSMETKADPAEGHSAETKSDDGPSVDSLVGTFSNMLTELQNYRK
jgi:hypothetical protein